MDISPKEALKRIQNPRLKSSTRLNLIHNIIRDQKMAFDLIFYPCFLTFSTYEQDLIIKGVVPFYLYTAINKFYKEIGDIKIVKRMIIQLARNPLSGKYVQYIFYQYEAKKSNLIFENRQIRELLCRLIIKHNLKETIDYIIQNCLEIIPEQYKAQIISLSVMNKLSK